MNFIETVNSNIETAGQPWRVRDHLWLLSLLIVCAGFYPMLSVFFRQQWQRPEYQAFPLLLIFAAWFLWSRMQEATPVNRTSWWMSGLGWLALIVSLGVLAASFWIFSPWLAMIAFVGYAFGVSCFIWQNWIVDGLWGIWFLLVLLVPPPLDRDQMFIESLQLFSSRFTSVMLDGFGVLHVMEGNVLSFPDRQLFVDEACSGIVSLISVVYCIALFCVWQRRRLLHSVTLVAAGVGWTILMNSIRLLTIGLAWHWFQVDLATGIAHQVLAGVMFAITIGMVVLLDRLLQVVFTPIDIDWRIHDRERHPGLNLMRIWNRLFANRAWEPDDDPLPDALVRKRQVEFQASLRRFSSWPSTFGLPAACCFGLLGFFLSQFRVEEFAMQTAVHESITKALAMSEELDPGKELGLKLVKFSDARRELFRWDLWGQYSRTWFYEDESGIEYTLSCDFLFGPHWHDLRVCYRGTGWKVDSEDIVRFEDLGKFPREPLHVESSLIDTRLVEQFGIVKQNEPTRGWIAYGAFRATGEWFNRPRGSGLIGDFWAHLVQGRDRAEQADYYQVQVSTNYEGELSPAQQQLAERLLKVGTNRFYDELVIAPGER
jgi:exosortase